MYINAEETAEETAESKGMSVSYTPLEEDSYLISPKFKASCWKILDLSEPDSPDWKRAVKIFYDRLNGRFLAPIKSIEEHADPRVKWFNGFSIIALDCLVIETLYQFYYGVDETDIGHNSAFWRFFKSSPYFSQHFTREKSSKFYSHFRCGLLHQGHTKEYSTIRVNQPKMVQFVDVREPSKGLIIDREKFHKALLNEIEHYRRRLLVPQSEEDFELRECFVMKMNFIVK